MGDVLRQSDCGSLLAARGRVAAVLRDQVSRDLTNFGFRVDTGAVALARTAANSLGEAASINLTKSVIAVTEIRTKDGRLLPA